jgi:hypothetical protein
LARHRIDSGKERGGPAYLGAGRRNGTVADLFVTGRAVSRAISSKHVSTDIGDVDNIQCRARLEIKAVRVETGDVVYTDALTRTGAPEPDEDLASETSLQQAAEEIGPSLIASLDVLSHGATESVAVEVRGIASEARAVELVNAVGQAPGVLRVDPGEYESHHYEFEVSLRKAAWTKFAHYLETAPSLRRFHLSVQSSNQSRIVANVQ